MAEQPHTIKLLGLKQGIITSLISTTEKPVIISLVFTMEGLPLNLRWVPR